MMNGVERCYGVFLVATHVKSPLVAKKNLPHIWCVMYFVWTN